MQIAAQAAKAEERALAERLEVLELVLSDGSIHPYKGKFLMADREIDPATGAILLVGQFPNPGNVLRPGQSAVVRLNHELVEDLTALRKGALVSNK